MTAPKTVLRCLCTAIVCATAIMATVCKGAAPLPAAEIVSLEGKGEYREPQQIDWRPAVVKQAVFPSYFVRTGDLSKMALLFADRTQIRLAQNSVLQIKEVSQGKDQKTILNLNSGRGWMQSKTVPGGLIMETPSALASIRGTDWEIAVDGEGSATLTVFSGEVDFYNDQGRVLVGRNEQARAEKGRAPVKLLIQNPRERIQWVSSLKVDPHRYSTQDASAGARTELSAITALIDEGQPALALDRLRSAVANERTDSAAARLLLADFLAYDGKFDQAGQSLADAAAKFPADDRIDAAQARLALLRDDSAAARTFAQTALRKNARSVDALLALGDVARFEGMAKEAFNAYSQAAAVSPGDSRPWLGLGVIEAERENVTAARGFLEKAILLDTTSASSWGELATLESAAGDAKRALEAFDKALALQPDNYIMLTGKGLLELKLGHNDAALDTLLRASLIEPRYARAHLYQAVAYYRMERPDRALQELEKVTELDSRDPLPHLLASLVRIDSIEPALAVQDAREAVRLMPYLKSLNQVANNQAGAANLGNAMAFFGMESWARHIAQESYLPFWAGSHLFLADRYPGEFNRRSELMQGFLLDPIVFGASNRYQSLAETPGNYATVSLRNNRSDDLKLVEPVVTANGYALAPTPVAYFLEAIDTRITPGNTALDADAKTFTAALGLRPRWDMAYFVYANHLAADIDLGTRDVTGLFQRVSGYNDRVDAGGHYALDASSQIWFKAGYGNERSTVDQKASILLPGQSFAQQSNFVTRPQSDDVQLRHTFMPREGREITWGVEAARLNTSNTLFQDTGFHAPGSAAQQNALDSSDRDHSAIAYGSMRLAAEPWRIEALLAWSDYEKDRNFHIVAQSPVSAVRDIPENYSRKNANGAAGVVYRTQAGQVGRFACQDWTRPASLGTLAPVAVAGIVMDDQLVFSGGKISRCRAQLEWEAAQDTFLSFSAGSERISNLVSPLDGVLNTRADVTNLDRLRNRVLPLPPKPDALEDTPVFSEGKVSSAAVTIEHIVAPSLAARFNYAYTDSANTSGAFRDNRIPYLPRHQAGVGATWTWTARSYVSAQAVYRSIRFADEANQSRLDAGWDMQLRGYVEFDRKHWSLEAYAMNLLKKNASDVFGVILNYRF
jgi:tetratricopeptide (TPR) repeat protein